MVIKDWNENFRKNFRRQTVQGRHDLHLRPELTREALVELLDTADPDFVSIYSDQPNSQGVDFGRVDRAGYTGEEIMSAVESGAIWIVIRRIDRVGEAYAALATDIENSIEQAAPNTQARQWHHKILVSSPGIHVTYHVDPMDTILWHINGPKSFYCYPNTETFVSDPDLEEILLQQKDEELPFKQDFENSAVEIGLKPGDFVSWAQYSPHRVQNGNGVNVSISSEYFTPESQIRSGAVFFNGWIRRRFNLKPKRPKQINLVDRMKWVSAKAIRTLKMHRPIVKNIPPIFRLNPDATGCVEEV